MTMTMTMMTMMTDDQDDHESLCHRLVSLQSVSIIDVKPNQCLTNKLSVNSCGLHQGHNIKKRKVAKKWQMKSCLKSGPFNIDTPFRYEERVNNFYKTNFHQHLLICCCSAPFKDKGLCKLNSKVQWVKLCSFSGLENNERAMNVWAATKGDQVHNSPRLGSHKPQPNSCGQLNKTTE